MHGCFFKALGVLCMLLSLLCSVVAEYQRNKSSPLFKLCLRGRPSQQESFQHYQLLEGPVGLYEIRLFDALQSLPRNKEDGNRPDNYRDVYEKFQRVTNCLPWQTIVDRWHSHEEIKTLARDCLCSSIRNAFIGSVVTTYPCDVAAAPKGQLSTVYLALGHRINVLRRLVVHLHGNANDLERYDAFVDECFTQFFLRVNATIQTRKSAASGVVATRAKTKSKSKPSSFPGVHFLVALLVITAFASALLFYHHELRRQRVNVQSAPVDIATAVDEIIANTDGVAHPD